jgi:transcriptional regulator with XRE-family HTH domain
MLELTSSLREELIRTGDDKEYRHAYADENLNATIATQIKVLREQGGWKQMDLAREAGMKQPMISRYENVNYSSWSINTLKRLAFAFDVILDVRFRSFHDLVESTEKFSREALQVPRFTEDPYFKEEKKEPKKAKKEKVAAEIPWEGVTFENFPTESVQKLLLAGVEVREPSTAAENAAEKLSDRPTGQSAKNEAFPCDTGRGRSAIDAAKGEDAGVRRAA